MKLHIAVLDKERCHPKRCNHECQFYCPPVRSGIMAIDFPEPDSQAVINEPLCIGCGICVRRCPFGAIRIVTVPDEYQKEVVHQYSLNSFRLYGLPSVSMGKVTSIIGQNGLGKSTTMRILSGIIIPNFGNYEKKNDRELVVKHFAGSQMGDYFRNLYDGKYKAVLKDQNVDLIPKVARGTIGDLLKSGNQNGNLDEVVSSLGLEGALNKDVSVCSGGELQKLAIGSVLLKEADIYLFDEMSSYLDVWERLRVAGIVQKLAKSKIVMTVEHDLAILDWMSEETHIVYGETGVYGMISKQRATSKAINSFLEGYLRDENVRIRNYPIEFQLKSDRRKPGVKEEASWSQLSIKRGDFQLSVQPGKILAGEVIGVMGRNALGKTTFISALAGAIPVDSGTLSRTLRISYKPQYISTDFEGTVLELLKSTLKDSLDSYAVKAEIIKPLEIEDLYDLYVNSLSGGELQRVAIALTLAREADLYLLDEPSAHLDSAYRMAAARIIRRVMENNKKSALIVDHDVYFIDLISDSLMVFLGNPGISGEAFGPLSMKDGMNAFLKDVGITFRRDGLTKRPRINKTDSRLDKSQKLSGNYYYSQ
ncbi:MAG: ribosome biogenesis/translation initiation ATPase RLI [Thermoplasmataceae archaeon]